jgi:hypothetical protein
MKYDVVKTKIRRGLTASDPAVIQAGEGYLDARSDAVSALTSGDTELDRLAKHYHIDRDELVGLLLSRSAITLNYLTNYRVRATKDDLRALLREMNTQQSRLVGQLGEQVARIDAALSQAELVHTESLKVLADYGRRCKAEASSEAL